MVYTHIQNFINFGTKNQKLLNILKGVSIITSTCTYIVYNDKIESREVHAIYVVTCIMPQNVTFYLKMKMVNICINFLSSSC